MNFVQLAGFEEMYFINKIGEIKSKRYGKILKGKINKSGYHTVGLYKNKKYVEKMVHRLVYETFFDKIPFGMQINHIDGKKLNNHILNLEVVTASENCIHAYKIGLKDSKGEKHSQSKLTEKEVIEIRKSSELGITLAKKYGVTKATISLVKNRRLWKHVGTDKPYPT